MRCGRHVGWEACGVERGDGGPFRDQRGHAQQGGMCEVHGGRMRIASVFDFRVRYSPETACWLLVVCWRCVLLSCALILFLPLPYASSLPSCQKQSTEHRAPSDFFLTLPRPALSPLLLCYTHIFCIKI
jgi:hypothetical protein